jgi:hypothetical protein
VQTIGTRDGCGGQSSPRPTQRDFSVYFECLHHKALDSDLEPAEADVLTRAPRSAAMLAQRWAYGSVMFEV